jgi:hypothetical protein
MNILRFLICSGRLGGPQRISTRQMTVADDLFGCYSYVCQDKAEFDKLSREYVAKQNKRFWGDVDVFNTETRKRSKVNDVIGVLLKSETEAAEKAFEAITPGSPPVEFTLDCIKATLDHYTRVPGMDLKRAMECIERIRTAAFETIQEPILFAPTTETAGSMPLSQTPGDSQSGGEQSPAESKGTLSEDRETDGLGEEETLPPDFAADLAANGAVPEPDDVGDGTPAEESSADSSADPTPTSPAPAKRKPGRPAKAK